MRNRASFMFAVALFVTVAVSGAAVGTGEAAHPGEQDVLDPGAFGFRTPEWKSDGDMHQLFVDRFRAAVGLGRARMFSSSLQVSPGMQLTLRVPNDEDTAAAPIDLRYALTTLELIGIARHEPPVAFVIDTHTDRSRAGRTRGLTGFEQRALAVLRSGDNTTAQTTKDGRRVAGAIRATNECLGCHATFKGGELLGAFSYQLTPVQK